MESYLCRLFLIGCTTGSLKVRFLKSSPIALAYIALLGLIRFVGFSKPHTLQVRLPRIYAPGARLRDCGRNLLNPLRVLTPATKPVTLLRLSPL
jgi:hypothetical protein